MGMDVAPLLAAAAALLAAAGVWEIAGGRGEELGAVSRRALATLSGGRARSLADAALRLGIPERLMRAGLDRRFGIGAVLAAKVAGAGGGALVSLAAAPGLPGRLSLVAAVVFPVAGFMAPDALLEREARRRMRRLVVSLPDALDLLAVGAEAGRSPGAVLGEIAAATSGPLATELAIATAEIGCGASQGEALAGLRDRVRGGEVAALTAALERSQRYGSPLADQLRDRATSLRHDQRRRIEEQAARAAPKIQLVVALCLVPSVLLMIVAALVANAELLLGGL
jgi:tight adherence protein C